MIRLAVFGWDLNSRKLFQWKVPTLTMIITATSAAIGIRDTQSEAQTTSTSNTAPATRHARRPRAPEPTLITDWPIIAQPARSEEHTSERPTHIRTSYTALPL